MEKAFKWQVWRKGFNLWFVMLTCRKTGKTAMCWAGGEKQVEWLLADDKLPYVRLYYPASSCAIPPVLRALIRAEAGALEEHWWK